MVLRSDEMAYGKKVACKGIKTFDPVFKGVQAEALLVTKRTAIVGAPVSNYIKNIKSKVKTEILFKLVKRDSALPTDIEPFDFKYFSSMIRESLENISGDSKQKLTRLIKYRSGVDWGLIKHFIKDAPPKL